MAALVLGALVWPGRASAHASLAASDPEPGAHLREAPTSITIVFTEPVEPSVTSVELWDQEAKRRPLGAPTFPQPDTVVVAVPERLSPGHYTVVWRNLSTVDAHTWQGSLVFTVLLPDGSPPGGMAAVIDAGASSDRPSALDSAARWIVFLAAAVLAGGMAFALVVARPAVALLGTGDRERMWSATQSVALAASTLALALAFEGALLQLLGQADRLGDLGRADDLLLHTRFGKYLLARQGIALAGLVLAAAAWRMQSSRAGAAAMGGLLTAGVGLLLTGSLVSHAAASDGAVWSTTIDFAHALGSALWVGALIVLGFTFPRWLEALRAGPRTVLAAESFRRFSALATVAVALIVGSGVLSTFVQVEAPSDLWSTNWGRALSTKLGLAVLLLGVGAYNAYALRPRIVRAALRFSSEGRVVRSPGQGANDALRALHRLLSRTVRLEAALGVAVLAAVAALTQLQSPASAAKGGASSAIERARPSALSQATEVGVLQLFLSVDPGLPGRENTFNVGVASEFASVPEIESARLQFVRDGAEPIALDLDKASQSTAQASFVGFGDPFSGPGVWTVEADLRFADGQRLGHTFDVTIGDVSAPGGGTSLWRWPLEGWAANAVFAISVATVGLAAVWQFTAPGVRRPARRVQERQS